MLFVILHVIFTFEIVYLGLNVMEILSRYW